MRLLVAIAALFAAALPARGQDVASYPSRPVKVIVSAPAGGGVDIVTRIVADGLQKKFGQPFVVENRGGAAGNIGAEVVFTSPPDGYTLLAAQPAPLTINPLLYRKLNFDPAQFELIAIMSTVANVLLVRPDFPAATAQEFITYAKAHPDKVNYASQGIGTTSHLTAELFEEVAGVELHHVPYRGTGPALNDLVAGHVDMVFMELASAINLHRGGRARILAIATAQRLPELPDVPTLDEVGVKDFQSGTWNALAAPPKTPRAIVERLNAAVNEVLADLDIRGRLNALTLQVPGWSTFQSVDFIKRETRVWGEVIKKAGVPPN